METLEYCQSNHLQDNKTDLHLHLRLCRFCHKAMCETCFEVHKNHCCGQTQSGKRNVHDVKSTAEGPTIKRLKPSAKTGAPISSNLHLTQSTTIHPSTQNGNEHVFARCPSNSMLEDQFCVSHCTLVCENCSTEYHETCNVKPVTDVCKDLDHTTVTLYKTWLNNLRVSTIELKTLLGRSLDGAEKHKITALNELQNKILKANTNLNHAHLSLKTEIENTFDIQFSELREKIATIEEINDKLDRSLKDAGPLEGSRMDTKLLLKLLNAITKYNIRTVPLELSTLGGEFRKVNCSFIANNRYQPLSSRSNLGRINTSITKLSPSYTMPTPDLSHVFTKLMSNHAPSRQRTESESPNKTTTNQITLTSGDITISTKLVSTADKEKTEREDTLKDFTEKATGEYAAGNAMKFNDQQNYDGNVEDDEHINTDEIQSVNGNNRGMTGFSRQLMAENETIGRTVGESAISEKHMSATLKDVSAPTKQNKNNVVLLNGSPYVLVPYKPIKPKCGKGRVVSCGSTKENNQSANTIKCRTDVNTLHIPRLSAQTKLLNSLNKKDVIEPQINALTNDQTRACFQMNTANDTNSQSAFDNEKASSDKTGPRAVMLPTTKPDNASKLLIKLDECGLSRGSNARMNASAFVGKLNAMPTALSYRQNTISFDDCTAINRETTFEQHHNFPPYSSLASIKPNAFSNSMLATQALTEMRQQKEKSKFEALISAPSSIPPSSQMVETIATDSLQHNSNVCNNSAVPLDLLKRDTVNGTSAANAVQTFSYAVDNGATTDLSRQRYTYNNVTDIAKNHASAVRKTLTASHNTEQQFSMSNANGIEYGKSDCLSPTGSHVNSLTNMPRDNYNHFNEDISSDNNPLITNNLTQLSTAQTDVENSACTTAMVDDTMAIRHNKRVLFTELHLEFVRQINIRITSDREEPDITGCVFLSDGRSILCDNENENLKLLDKSFTVYDSLDLPSFPFDISVVNDTTAIITLSEAKQLQYIEVTPRLKLGSTIQLDKYCWGVQVVGSDIYVTCRSDFSCDDGEVRILDKYGNLRRRLGVNSDGMFMFSEPDYLTVSERSKRIYVSDWQHDTVTCMKPDGAVIFQYKDPELESPAGLCVDDEDNVIVCGNWSHNIHIVTAAGEKSSVILTANDGIRRPDSVAYRRTDNTMIVGCRFNDYLFIINFDEKNNKTQF